MIYGVCIYGCIHICMHMYYAATWSPWAWNPEGISQIAEHQVGQAFKDMRARSGYAYARPLKAYHEASIKELQLNR